MKLQTAVGLILLFGGLGVHAYTHYALKVEEHTWLIVAGVGLFMLPFDFSRLHAAYARWRGQPPTQS